MVQQVEAKADWFIFRLSFLHIVHVKVWCPSMCRYAARLGRCSEPQQGNANVSRGFCCFLLKEAIFPCSDLGCVLPREEVALNQSSPASSVRLLSVSILVPVALQCYLKPFTCHSVLIMVQLLYFICAICLAHFHLALVTYSTTISMLFSKFMCSVVLLNCWLRLHRLDLTQGHREARKQSVLCQLSLELIHGFGGKLVCC